MKKWIVSILILLLAILVFGGVIVFNKGKEEKIAEFLANRPIPEFTVTASVIESKTWTPYLRAIGFIEPIQGVNIANEAPGKITKINFICIHS